MQSNLAASFRIILWKTILRHLALLMAFVTAPAFAQYKCVVNGKTIYADAPCATNAKNVGALEDSVSKDQEIQRLRQSLSEKKQRNNIEGRQNAEYQANQKAIAAQQSSEATQAKSAESAKRRRCETLRNEITTNQQAVARYKDFGWQQSLTQRENDLKANKEEFERNCR